MSKEPLIVKWLPLGHVSHGYRRVFILSAHKQVQYVIVLSLMGYEEVYNVKQKVKTHEIQDPALLWGLSFVKSLIDSGTLSESEDGYLSIRPKPLGEDELLPIDEFLKAEKDGEFYIEAGYRQSTAEE